MRTKNTENVRSRMEQQRKEDFGKYLKLLRKEKKYKQDEVAEFLGIKRQAY